MKLNKVKIENFLSVKEAEVNFEDYSELVRVVGVNKDTKPKSSNGAGKSSLVEAVAFALFGKTIRKTTEKSISNSRTKGKCKVTLTVNDDVVIERTKKPPMLKVTVGGESYTQEGIQATQKYLENFLNINPSVFLASIVFGQSNTTNFLTSSAEEKRNIIQSFLNVSELFGERHKIKSLKSKHQNEKKVALTLQSDSNDKLQKMQTQRKNLAKAKKKVNSLFNSEKSAFIKAHTLSEIRELERDYREVELEYYSHLSQIEDKGLVVKRAEKRVSDAEGGACEHCGKVSLERWKSIKNDEKLIKEIKKEITKLQQNWKILKVTLTEIEIPVSVEDFEEIEKVKDVERDIDLLKSLAKDEKKIHKKHSDEVFAATKNYDLMRFWETAFSEQGLVRYIVRNILSFFNERSNYYLGFLTGGNFSINFTELLHDEIKNNGTVVFFDALSGGEKKKVSLAVMLALNDLLVLSGKDRSNVILFDEIADSLDEEGIKGLYELIQQITTTKRLFVITHNDNLTSLIEDWADELLVTKHKHLTTMSKV